MARVLVVDDSGTMRKIIIRSLNSLGVTETVEAADGNQALQLFQGQAFDAILTDWNMPNMNGLELLKAVRGAGSKLPVILITTESEKTRIVEAVQAGVSDYLVKPFDSESLRAKLERFIGALAC